MIPRQQYVAQDGALFITYGLVRQHHSPTEVETFAEWLAGRDVVTGPRGAVLIFAVDYERWLAELATDTATADDRPLDLLAWRFWVSGSGRETFLHLPADEGPACGSVVSGAGPYVASERHARELGVCTRCRELDARAHDPAGELTEQTDEKAEHTGDPVAV